MSHLSGSWGSHGLDVQAPPDGQAGPWRVWLRGQPEGWQRLAGEHDLGEPGSLPAAQVLAELCDKVGPDRALPQVDGHWHGILAEGSNSLLVRGRVGLGAWFWMQDGDRLHFAEHPAALPERGPLALDRLLEEIAGQASAGLATPWRRGCRGCPRATSSPAPRQRPRAVRWWDPGQPPPGRAGNRACGPRGPAGARPGPHPGPPAGAPGPWTPSGGPRDAFVEAHASSPAHAGRRGPLSEAILPGRRRRLARPWAGRRGPPRLAALLRPGGAAPPAGRRRRGPADRGPLAPPHSDPAAWRAYATDTLPDRVLGPLGALARARDLILVPALCHPVVLPVLGQIPWRHLRGLRGSLGRRLDLHPPEGEPWAPWMAGEGADLMRRLSQENSDLGPIPKDPAAAARYLVVALWRQAHAGGISRP